jgi:type I restriction enzyme R subunit
MSQFVFLQSEFLQVYDHARKAETIALSDPRSSCFYARLALETAIKWMYASDKALRTPYDEALSALIYEPTFRNVVGEALVTKARLIKDLGNRAVHDTRDVAPQAAANALRELFHFSYWLVHTYAKGPKPNPAIQFSVESLPRTANVEATTLLRLQEIAKRFADQAQERDAAKRDFIASLRNYYTSYYNLRSLTLYNFVTKAAISYEAGL